MARFKGFRELKVLGLAVLALVAVSVASPYQVNTLPAEISNAEFSRMISEFSESTGSYTGDNWISNEASIQNVIPALRKVTKPGGAYIGVGPEQNFTYMWALQSRIGFIIDIRRQNMLEMLMLKTLFELSPNRAEFVSRLFSRRRPAGLDGKTSVSAMFGAFETAPKENFAQNLLAVRDTITKRQYGLSNEDLATIDFILAVFYRGGPSLTAEFASPNSPAGVPVTYVNHMTATDANKSNWSFLGTEEAYQWIREMQRKNLIIPLVGDFAGSKAIRQVGQYLRQRNTPVAAFYLSNVEYYLQGQALRNFQMNAATLPVDTSSMFIRWVPRPGIPNLTWFDPRMGNVPGTQETTLAPITELIELLKAGRAPTSWENTLKATRNPAEFLKN